MEEKFMREALKQAKRASALGEMPVGAVIVRDGEIISRAYNRRETKKNALYHAEITAIDRACKKLGGWRLPRCEMYVTLEPCPMCAGALIQSRIDKVYIGAKDHKNGCVGSICNLLEEKFTHKVEHEYLDNCEECSQILTDFFKELRKSK